MPEITRKAENFALQLTDMAEKGLKFDPATADAIGRSEAWASRWGRVALWIIAVALVVIAAKLTV
jgi:ubiquinone biosynthesis protein